MISARLDQPTQLNFINLVWAYINAERPTIAAQAKALFISLLDFLDKVSSLARTSQPSASTKTLPLLGSDLLARSLAALERKKSLVLLELLVVRYGSEPVLGAQPELYRLLLDGLDSIDGGAGRRGKIALMLLKSSARHVGVNEKELEKTPVDVWAKWCKSWQGPLVDALRSDNERRRQQIAAYFLAGLFDYAPPTFQAVIFSLLDTPVEPETSDQADNNLRAVLVVLRTGKLRGLCRVGDTALEAESENHVLLGSATEEQTYSTISKPLQTIVPTPLLTACAISSSTEAQLAALGLVAEARLVSSPLSSADYAVLRTFFTYNMTITSAEVRGQVNGIFIKLLTRLRTSSYAAARDAARLEGIEAHERTAEEAARLVELQGAVEDVRSFFQWFYTLICRATHPGASYQHVVSALTFLELLLSTGVDPRFTVTASSTGLKPGKGALSKNLSTFSQAYPFALDLVTPALTLRLLACFDSTFDDIQRRALALLCRFPSPLPGLETREVAERLILRKAARLLLSTRDSESSAAASLIQLYQHSYVSALGWRATSLLSLSSAPSNGTTQGDASPSSQPSEQLALLSLLHDLLSFLSAQLAVAESGNLLAAAASHPLHGVLTTLQQLCSSLDLTRAPLNAHLDEIRTIYQRALTLIDRTWEVTRGVLCHVAPEGSTGQEAVGDQEEDADGFDDPLPDEESARAMQVAGEEDGQGEAALAGPKHQVILSYSWRGMKEAR